MECADGFTSEMSMIASRPRDRIAIKCQSRDRDDMLVPGRLGSGQSSLHQALLSISLYAVLQVSPNISNNPFSDQ